MRLKGFDYKRPFFYMVTLKAASGAGVAKPRQFSELSANGLVENAITKAFRNVIDTFHDIWFCIEPIHYYVIMPDHLHLIIKIRDIEKRVSLPVIVRQLLKALEKSYHEVVGAERQQQNPNQEVLLDSLRESIFDFEWHDLIVKKQGQLAAFIRYIEENPMRAWCRQQNRRYFTRVRKVSFAGHEWYAYGNTELLELPIIEPFKCSRKWVKEGEEWRSALKMAERIGPAAAGVGTFMSPCEKECGNTIYKAGGALIVLYPEGFNERWHPTRNKEILCAKGRMLFLSLYIASPAKPDKATLYKRCHEMGDLVLEALASSCTGSASDEP